MANNIVPFRGVILTERERGSSTPPKPTKPSTPCPVCQYLIEPTEIETRTCDRCRAKYHAPCWWRLLPIEEWVAWLRWSDSDEAFDAKGRVVDHDVICAACRQGA